MSANYQKNAKVCLFGESSVGKTSLMRRFIEDKYDDKYITTIGTKVSKKRITIDHPSKENTKVDVTLMLWDIMGQKGFRHLLQESYFDGATAAIGVCDMTRRETLTELKGWMESILKVTGDIPIIIVGNKSDLADKAQVTIDNIREMAEKNVKSGWREDLKIFIDKGKGPYLLTSAKTGLNVEETFRRIAEMLL